MCNLVLMNVGRNNLWKFLCIWSNRERYSCFYLNRCHSPNKHNQQFIECSFKQKRTSGSRSCSQSFFIGNDSPQLSSWGREPHICGWNLNQLSVSLYASRSIQCTQSFKRPIYSDRDNPLRLDGSISKHSQRQHQQNTMCEGNVWFAIITHWNTYRYSSLALMTIADTFWKLIKLQLLRAVTPSSKGYLLMYHLLLLSDRLFYP